MKCSRRSDVRVQTIGDETLVLDDQRDQIHQLNATASFVWHQCDGQASVEKIAHLFALEFGVEETVAKQDVAVVLEKLRDLNLLTT